MKLSPGRVPLQQKINKTGRKKSIFWEGRLTTDRSEEQKSATDCRLQTALEQRFNQNAKNHRVNKKRVAMQGRHLQVNITPKN